MTDPGDGEERTPAAADDPEARRAGLCGRCALARRVVSGRGSTFWMCQAEGRPKYPPLPVLRCPSFRPG